MLQNFIENSELSGFHPVIDSYVSKEDITKQKNNSEKWLISRLKNINTPLRQLMIPLILTINESKEETDRIERLRLVVNLSSAPTEETIYTLQGSNDNTTFSNVVTLSFTTLQSGIRSITFNKPYKYYKLTCNKSVTPLESYLVETTYDLVLINVTLAYICNSLRKSATDIWSELYVKYIDDALEAFSTLIFPRDIDESGTLDTIDEKSNVKSVRLFT